VIISEEVYLAHYGTPRHSGRYPWGSGDDVTQRSKTFLDNVQKLQKQGLSNKEIAEGFGMTTTQLINYKTIARAESKAADIALAQRWKDKGLSNVEIGKKMGLNESSVRALLAPGAADKTNVLLSTTKMLRDQIDEKRYLDIGKGNEAHIGISKEKLRAAVAVLKDEGYKQYYHKVPQVTNPGKFTTMKVLCSPDVTYAEFKKNVDQIQQIAAFSEDGGRSYFKMQPPMSIDSNRIAIRYANDGGAKEDGVMYIRPGKDDLSIGDSRYAQVRVLVDGDRYLKGMAMYKDDLPDGVDIVFNTNKDKSVPKRDVLKSVQPEDKRVDPDNPFGSSIKKQLITVDKNGKEVLTSAMNIVNEEGDWDDWSRTISSQVLSKQNPILAKTQLEMTHEQKRQQYEDIMAMTNPVVKKKLLTEFADNVDSSAVHLEAAAMPRQSTHVILPMNSMKETEVYAPNFTNGEKVVLVRYPHGGIFEIPELTVNNKNPTAKKMLGQARDGIGINSKVAEKLSGADFDGDTVLVIPNPAGSRLQLKTAPTLEGLKGFDPKHSYPPYEGMPKMTSEQKGTEMGKVSNLITDMTIKGASPDEIARAVRHSMVVIDAEKHNLNYKQSAIDNGIPALKEKYQGGATRGAATLISRAGSEERVLRRKPRTVAKGGPIDLVTGEKKYEQTVDAVYVDYKTGKTKTRTDKSTKLAETSDAFTLVSSPSGTPIETVYATHSNKLKALANEARLQTTRIPNPQVSNSAKKAYATEVASLDAKLNIALKNSPLERQAQLIANTIVAAQRETNPHMDPADLKKVNQRAINIARIRTGAAKQDIMITDREWDAIQANAISNNKLTQILNHANEERVKDLATPKTSLLMTSAKTTRAKAMLASGYSQGEVAAALGVSLTTLKNSL
jgi:DNA-binding CsgD family transcriptional regulator